MSNSVEGGRALEAAIERNYRDLERSDDHVQRRMLHLSAAMQNESLRAQEVEHSQSLAAATPADDEVSDDSMPQARARNAPSSASFHALSAGSSNWEPSSHVKRLAEIRAWTPAQAGPGDQAAAGPSREQVRLTRHLFEHTAILFSFPSIGTRV